MYSDWVSTVLEWLAIIYCCGNSIEILYNFSDLLGLATTHLMLGSG